MDNFSKMKNTKQIMELIRNYIDEIPFEVGEFGIASHPLFSSYVTMDTSTNPPRLMQITKDNIKELKEQRYKYFEKILKKDKTFSRLFILIHKPFRIPIFVLLIDFLSEEEYNKNLIQLWTETEFPHQNGIELLINLFDKSKHKYLMNKNEKKVFKEMPNKITIYRGIFGEGKIKALSWTLDKEKAKWFATRFKEKGRIFKSIIEKKYIYAYKDNRGEKEVIINPNYFLSIKEEAY